LSESEPFDKKQLEDLANHLNNQHRASKQVQTESNEWFSSMYFLNSKNEDIVEGIIYTMKSNSISVYVPKFGLKSHVYVIDKEGDVIIPENDLKKIKNIQSCKMEFDQENLKMVKYFIGLFQRQSS
jgi:exoribonuclease R